ncbi:MAG TPA: C1 family peptidase [Bacteroidales bacterium]|nr:C1 family peptidase [Bacteroidales bacterium]HPF02228.1 C1 family peptidase [Bacteroidales bacterium]HPJ60424.1 C1 family peptidase [Bacteroidales bacterium]HPR11962.1 C1 family peptidase [Bacteroidales bacterium]HRW85746.1 C1 family peptidase [Bacteroidales bacterium]
MKNQLLAAMLLCSFLVFFGIFNSTDVFAQSFIVSFDKQGGTEGTNQVTAVAGKAMPVALSPLKAGVVFNGYYDAVSGGKQYYTPAMASASDWDKPVNTTLYAQWTTLHSAFSWGSHQGYNWLSTPKNQGPCGSCWAFCMAGSYEARKRIVENQPALTIDLSEQHMVSCWAGNCAGGGTPTHFDKLRDEGVPDEACFPYVGSAVACSSGCPDWAERVYKAASWTYLYQASVEDIKKEIMVNGPVHALMDVYEDLYNYSIGVYTHISGNFQGSKAVIIYGWDNANDCWLVVNTWGSTWGETGPGGTKGFFRVSISNHNCNFANYIYKIRPVRDYILAFPEELTIGQQAGSTGQLTVATETDWTVTDDASWLSLSTPGATGNATITVSSEEENSSSAPRTAIATIKARRISDISITIMQNGIATNIEDSGTDLYNYVKVYPIPFSDQINLENVQQFEKIVLTSLSGQLLLVVKPEGSQNVTIPASTLAGGTYLLNMYLPSGQKIVRKIVKLEKKSC